jgi:primosomal protein N'
MHYYEVAPTQIIRATSDVFTYASEQPIAVGQLVIIEVGKKSLIGIITQEVDKPGYATKAITSLIPEPPLPQPLLQLALWMSNYYATHLATVLQTVLPRGLQKTRRAAASIQREILRDRTKNVLNQDQLTAVETVTTMSPGSALLHGITGSGKTAVYIETNHVRRKICYRTCT